MTTELKKGFILRALVAGAGGFLGSHLVESLVASGNEVVAVDNFFTGSRANLFHLLGHPRFELIRHDVNFPLYVEVDVIYNLASPASPVHYQKDPVQTMKTNVMGAINLLGLAKRLKVPIFQASTSEVYGDPLEHPQREDYWGNVNPIGPRACYDEGKRAAETLFFDYQRQYGIPISVARIFNTYGPRMAIGDGRVVSNFIVQALRNEDITVYGNGEQTRSFCFVEDLIRGIRLMVEKGTVGPMNLGNPQETSIRELATTVIQMTGSKSKVTVRPVPTDDPKRRRPDISQAKALGWEPTVELSSGLSPTIDYFRSELGI